jgi:protein TonB
LERLMIVLPRTLLFTGAGAGAPAVIERPDWISMPSHADMADWMPDKAKENHVDGSVAIVCDVTAAGTLEKCVVAQEDPPNYGFGKAALKVARKFKMKPQSLDGQPTAGAQVTVPLRFVDSR